MLDQFVPTAEIPYRIMHNCVIGIDMHCNDCGYPVVACTGKTEQTEHLPIYHTSKFYCANTTCKNHVEVELPFREQPEWTK